MSKEIASARAFIGNYLQDIILMCNLKPIESWKKWEDDYGNRLIITSKKRIIIIPSKKQEKDLKISDLFVKSSYDMIYNHSYWLMEYTGDQDKISWMIGNDGRLRALYNNSTFHPLLSGFELLQYIALNFKNDELSEINSFENVMLFKEFTPISGYIKSIEEN